MQAHPTLTPMHERTTAAESQLMAEIAEWEAASDEDWLQLEASLSEAT